MKRFGQRRNSLGGNASAMPPSTFSMRFPQEGEGQKRAAVRLEAHREKQAARVEPAIGPMRRARKAWAAKRVDRWRRNQEGIDSAAPGHIRAMAGEALR
jgi:hypothetical protein